MHSACRRRHDFVLHESRIVLRTNHSHVLDPPVILHCLLRAAELVTEVEVYDGVFSTLLLHESMKLRFPLEKHVLSIESTNDSVIRISPIFQYLDQFLLVCMIFMSLVTLQPVAVHWYSCRLRRKTEHGQIDLDEEKVSCRKISPSSCRTHLWWALRLTPLRTRRGSGSRPKSLYKDGRRGSNLTRLFEF